MAGSFDHPTEELQAARQDLKDLVTTLYRRLDELEEVEDDFELDPDKNIIDNFTFKQKMRCEPCKIQFDAWSEIDLHNATHHAHQPGDQRCCTVCGAAFESWQERDTHMLMQHPLDSNTTPAPTVPGKINAMWCCSLCSDSKHYVDQDHWRKHFKYFHTKYMGNRINNWMVTQCDIKGRGIVYDANAKLECTLCEKIFPYNPDIFNFDLAHGYLKCHVESVRQFLKQKKELPVKFLKIVNLEFEISGLFHPHELQSSCCCRALGCEFCGLHKSMLNKFPEGSVVWCNVCESNFKWKNVESGIQHVNSGEHYKKLCNYVSKTGVFPAFGELFKKQGQFIESISTSRRVVQ